MLTKHIRKSLDMTHQDMQPEEASAADPMLVAGKRKNKREQKSGRTEKNK